MADITMCYNETCKQQATCYRRLAKPNPYGQSMASFVPDEEGNCSQYWKVSKSQQRRLDIQTAD